MTRRCLHASIWPASRWRLHTIIQTWIYTFDSNPRRSIPAGQGEPQRRDPEELGCTISQIQVLNDSGALISARST
jgi:hypothetical protein